MLAGDVELWFTSGADDSGVDTSQPAVVSMATTLEGEAAPEGEMAPEGEAAPDLVGFAKALAAAEVRYFGAAWCPACTVQKQLFGDGGEFLPFIEVTNSDRTLNEIGVAAEIETFPTWDFPDGTRATGVLSLTELSERSGVAIPQSASPSFVAIGDQAVAIGSPLHVPVNAYNPAGGPITVSVTVDDPDLLEAVVLSGNRSIRMNVAGYGEMVFELFEERAPRPAGRVIELAESGFYDDTIFHRIINGFVIQGGDPTGTGTGGSELGNFDDQYHPELQHNRSGVLSFAKSTDDTNNSQFFITDGPTRTLDFNHSIFGQLVAGESVRQAINAIAHPSDKGTNANDRPLIDIVLESVSVFEDTENSVVMLKAKGDQTGTTTVTFTATNAAGESFSEQVTVSVVADSGVGSNSPPFLEDISLPASFPNNAPATLQLSSIDVEGDPVEYFVSTSSDDVTATVDATSGLVTVTPESGFTGAANVVVGVRPAPGVEGALANQSDTQRLTFNFVSSQALTAPTSVSLDAASDTGTSDSDRITRAGTLSFTVTGVQTGAEVILFAGSTEVGRATATGTTTKVVTNNIAALGDGTYSITARQVVDGQTSSASPALSITYDSTRPNRIANFPTAANVGVPLNVNLNHPEEGLGLIYGFSEAPEGVTIDSQTGVIAWTPTAAQIGDQEFTLTLTDVAGNVRSETFIIGVAAAPQAEARLEVTNLDGEVIDRIEPGDEFLLRFYAGDRRGTFDRQGVFAAFVDIRFDNELVAPVTSVPIAFGPNFGDVVSSGSFGTGVIDELGAVTNSLSPGNSADQLIATVRMEALKAGTVSFITEPADESGNEFLLFNEDAAIPDELVTFGRLDLLIGTRFTAADDTFTVEQGAAPTSLDVLANDSFASGISGTLTLTSLGTPSAGGTVTIDDNRVRYQPAAEFVGSETFTYVVTDETGVTDTATVTVTVTSESATQPTAVDDTFTVLEDAPLASFDVLANDIPSAPGETITVTAVGTSSQGSTVELGDDGASIRYQPAPNFNGTETITYTLTDSGGGTATGTVTFNVTPVNDPPPADDITRDVFRGDSDVVIARLEDFGINVDGDEELTVAIVGTPSGGGTFTVDGTTIRYTPASDFVGTDTVDYTTTDPGGLSSTGTLTVNVLDSLPTNYKLQISTSGRPVKFADTFLVTITRNGGGNVPDPVSLNSTDGVIEFNDLAPGDYVVEVPAIPFLNGMSQPQRLSFTAPDEGGDLSGVIETGSLHLDYLRLEDFFTSSSRDKVFAVLAEDESVMATIGHDRTTIQNPLITINGAGESVSIEGQQANAEQQLVDVEATIESSGPRFQTRDSVGDLRLVRLNLSGLNFTQSAAATESATAQSAATQQPPPAAEGESSTAATLAADSPLLIPPIGGEAEDEDGLPADAVDAYLSSL